MWEIQVQYMGGRSPGEGDLCVNVTYTTHSLIHPSRGCLLSFSLLSGLCRYQQRRLMASCSVSKSNTITQDHLGVKCRVWAGISVHTDICSLFPEEINMLTYIKKNSKIGRGKTSQKLCTEHRIICVCKQLPYYCFFY